MLDTHPTACIPTIIMRRTTDTVFIISNFFILIAPITHSTAAIIHSAVSNIRNQGLTFVPTSSPASDPMPTFRKIA